MPMIPYPGVFCRSRLCPKILMTPERKLTLVYPAHDCLFKMPEARPALRFPLPRSRVKLLNLSSRILTFARKRREKGKPPPSILKAQSVAENVALMRLKRTPVRLKLDAPTIRLINQHTQLNACRAMRAQLLDEIFLRHARIEHAFDQKQIAP